ncbi:hypothetical protein PENTCL1PPCAC_12786, partial [Pristionchus entomophagus]
LARTSATVKLSFAAALKLLQHPMGLNFAVDGTQENVVFWSLHSITALTVPIDLLTIYLLWKKSPKQSVYYRKLLLALQICCVLIELHMGVLFAPVLLFPLIGLYSQGLLGRIHFPPHYSVVLFYFLVLACLIILNFCVFYRHQSILPSGHFLKLEKKRNRYLLYSLYAIALESMCVSVVFSGYDESPGDSIYLEKNHPAMLWLVAKESWVVYDPNSSTRLVVYHVILCLAVAVPLFFLLIRHIYMLLSSRISEMSVRTLAYHRAMVNSLIMQSLCWLAICVPVAVLIASFLLATIPQKVTSAVHLVAQLFPLLNALTVLLNTPTIRKTLRGYLPFHSNSISPKMSTVHQRAVFSHLS